jgi:sulfite exporter TauE/SafE
MRELLYEPLAELLSLVFYALVAGVMTAVGLVSEQNGLHQLATGHDVQGAFLAYMGALLLYGGVYLLGYKKVLPKLRAQFAEPS